MSQMSATLPSSPSISSPLLSSNLVHIAVIGTAGRGPDGLKLTRSHFERMLSHVIYLQQAVWKLPNHRVVWVSGGSAWTDHVAVRLFIQQATGEDGAPYAGLQLFMPCALTSVGESSSSSASSSSTSTVSAAQVFRTRAVDNGSWKWQINPGRLLNQGHDAFGKTIGRNTLDEIKLAETLGAKLCFDGRGFHARNKLVAKRAERMIAFTWGDDTTSPIDGGTGHTWQLCKINKVNKVHVSLRTLAEPLPIQRPTSNFASTPPSLLSSTPLTGEDVDSGDPESISHLKRKSSLAEVVADQFLATELQPRKKSKTEKEL